MTPWLAARTPMFSTLPPERPRQTNRSVPNLCRLLPFALFWLATAVAAAEYDLPSIGQPADNVLSPAQEKEIGEQVVAQLLDAGAIEEDPQVSEYLNRIGRRLARHTERAPDDFNFYLIDDTTVNAFALPGGYIGVNAGLILESQSESQLAGVLAHEIAHVTQRHIARQIQATQGMTWATAAAALLAIIAGGGNPAVVQAAIALGAANLGQQQINYTRSHELEADRLGIRTLAQADYDPAGMSGFFERMERRARLYGNRLPEILLTHPISTTRISEAESRARDYRDVKVREFDDYADMRARVRVLSSRQPSDEVQYFEKQLEQDADNPALQYGRALALMRVGRLPPALEQLRALADRPQTHPHYLLGLAQARSASGDLDGSLTTLERAQSRYPSYRPVTLAHARTLIDSGQAAQARELLLSRSDALGQDDQFHHLLANAASELGRPAEAYYQQAVYYHLRGQYAASIHQLRTALTLPDISTNDRARVTATLNRYRNACERQHSVSECRDAVENINRRRRR